MKKYNITQSELNVKVDLHALQSINRFIFERKIYSIKDVLTSNVPLIVMVVGLYLLGILWCETLRASP